MPGDQDAHDAWWAAREAAYRQRPEIRQEIERLRAEAHERARQDHARAGFLEQRIEQGAPGAGQALHEEMTRQAIEYDPPEPSAKDDPEEWRAFFREMYGRDMPLNAEYQAELHRIEAAAPPDVGGLAAAYSEANYPRGFDEIELAAEREGKTAEEVRAEREAALDSTPADATHDDDTELDAGLAGALGALAEHAPASRDASALPAGQPADSFADIWDAFARLRDALGLPGTPGGAEAAGEPADRASSGPGQRGAAGGRDGRGAGIGSLVPRLPGVAAHHAGHRRRTRPPTRSAAQPAATGARSARTSGSAASSAR